MALHFTDERGEDSLRYRNRAEITVLMCEQKPYPVGFLSRRESHLLYCEHSLNLFWITGTLETIRTFIEELV